MSARLNTRRAHYSNFASIDWPLETSNERIRQLSLQQNASLFERIFDAIQPTFLVIVIGLATGLLAAFLTLLSDWLGDLRTGICPSDISLNRNRCCTGFEPGDVCTTWKSWDDVFSFQSPWARAMSEYGIYVLLAICFATLSAFFARRYSAYAVHTGIPEIKAILGGFIIDGYLNASTLLIKSVGLVFAVASGLSLGKEGPLVHVSACIADQICKFFPVIYRNEARRREILSSAAAAGISVAFGAPLGGVLFSLEEMSSFFPNHVLWRSFICAVVAAVTLQYIDPLGTGKLLLFEVKAKLFIRPFEILPWLFMGICGGIFGHLFIKANILYSHFRAHSIVARYPLIEVATLGFITALGSYLVLFMRISTSELVQRLFEECPPNDPYGLCNVNTEASVIFLLLVTAVAKGGLTAITFGAQLPAGVFLPTTAIGACFGRAVGLIMDRWHRSYPQLWLFSSCPVEGTCISPPAYAVIGAASALGGVTRMTASLVVIIFELSGAVDLVIQIMVACMVSKFVGDSLARGGIYEAWINFRRFTFLSETSWDNRDDDLLAKHVMTDKLVTLTTNGWTIGDLERLLDSMDLHGFPIIRDKESKLLESYISRNELEIAISEAKSQYNVNENTLCYFGIDHYCPPTTSYSEQTGLPEPTAKPGSQHVDLGPWVDKTPTTLDVDMPWEIIVQMFTRLGLRYVLFTQQGALRGIMTKKDVYTVLQTM